MEDHIINVRLNSSGFIGVPVAVQSALGVGVGDSISFVLNGDTVRLANPGILAMERLQQGFHGAAEQAGIHSEEDVIELIKEVRQEQRPATSEYDESVS